MRFTWQKIAQLRESRNLVTNLSDIALVESYRSEEVRLLLLVRLPRTQLPLRTELEVRAESDEGRVLGRILLGLLRRVRQVEGGESAAISIFWCSGKDVDIIMRSTLDSTIGLRFNVALSGHRLK